MSFTAHLARHVAAPPERLSGATVAEVLGKYFRTRLAVRGYVRDDQGHVRKHVAIFVNDTLTRDRIGLADEVRPGDAIYVAQALSDDGERLALGSTTGGLRVSENQGDSWQCVSAHLPPINCVRFA